MLHAALFSRDFEAELARETEVELAATEALVSRDEVNELLAQARAEAYEAGLMAGRAQGIAETEDSIAKARNLALTALDARLAAMSEHLDEHQSALERDLEIFALSICEKALPELVEHYGKARMASEIAAILRRAQGSQWLEIRVSPKLRDEIERDLQAMAAFGSGTTSIRVMADPSCAPDCIRATWRNGRSDYSSSRLSQRILAELRREFMKPEQQGIAPDE
ncbi:hypothetical protein [Paracoccus ravus]|uniref:FliH/SctL family protein n=1 Tax=Paracoccus ravus TaxID=2447760 RepID=UPI00106F0045|nr:hypothetical protein [Paracoccus ravus]